MRLPTALLASLLLAACASDPAPVAVAPGAVGQVWVTIDDKAGLTPTEIEALAMQLGTELGPVNVAPGTPGANQLKVVVTGFRMTQDAARTSEGMVAGTDHMVSEVRLLDATDRPLDEHRVLTKGKRSLDTGEALARAHAADIADAVLGD
jgi:PBP1b-binding outer membrane lipoprotein LpoB